ncbi:MAG: amino acid ABC transporter permease [Cyanobacteriota bacterium]|nr:amino acid ABC transporter permease [Cyanobacteriota bacterium]
MRYNWNWSILFEDPYLGWILSGLGLTVLVSSLAWVIALVLGSLVGIARTVPVAWVRTLAGFYVEPFRNIPLLVQMFLWFFVLPEIVPEGMGRWLKRDLPYPEFWTTVIGLGFYTAARVADQVRAGIESVPKGKTQAGLASGLTWTQIYRFILLPLSYRLMLPPLTSEFLIIYKNSSLGLTIGLLELTAQARQIEDYTFQGFEAYITASLLYALITILLLVATQGLERQLRIPGLIQRGT